jgi:hypothetical protein
MKTEPVRPCYVLDWRDRMNAWRFEDRYKPPRPKSHRSSKVLVHSQIRENITRTPDAATTINSRPAHRSRTITKLRAETQLPDPFA